jgi:hypothetical protein
METSFKMRGEGVRPDIPTLLEREAKSVPEKRRGPAGLEGGKSLDWMTRFDRIVRLAVAVAFGSNVCV